MKKILLTLLFFYLPFSVSAEEINQFLTDITVNQDASITVTEAIEYECVCRQDTGSGKNHDPSVVDVFQSH